MYMNLVHWKKDEIFRAILASVGVVGIVLAAATVPNAALFLKPLVSKKSSKSIRQRSLEESLRRLMRQRITEFVVQNGKTFLRVTEKGRKRMKRFEFAEMRLDIPRAWRGIWTVILFDIPEYQKTARDALRRKLKELGCFQYHRSVFVHPSSCEDDIDFVVEFFQVSRFVIRFETNSLGNQEYRARRFFGLK